jgi:HD domain
MQNKIDAFKQHVRESSSNPSFVHHRWFVQWHLEVVEKIALELLEHHPEADAELVEVMVWLHDYGKTLDFDNQYAVTLTAGRQKLTELGFAADFVDAAITGIETLDKKMELDLHTAPIEVQIVSSADGCSHLAGPFLHIFWHEATDQTFTGKTLDELLQLNLKKIEKDWSRKITLPEARAAFEQRYQFMREQSGELARRFV